MDTEKNLADVETATQAFTVYVAGGIFTQHDLATNVFIKEAVWRQSKGKFELALPQSKELRNLGLPNLAAYIRNVNLSQIIKTDFFLARFDGLELDAGVVIEFMMAKFLGKPTVIWRCDSRRLGGENLDEPYNLMAKNWPRTVEIHFDSLFEYIGGFAEEWQELENVNSFQKTLQAEQKTVREGIDELARELIAGLETVHAMKSPYPDELLETVYQASRYTPGSGFEQFISAEEVNELIIKFRQNGTL